MKLVSSLFIMMNIKYELSLCRNLLESQSQPEPTRVIVFGVYGQNCTPQSDDNPPDNCIQPGQSIFSPSGKMECSENFDCCLCGSIKCGFTQGSNGNIIPCDIFHVNGDSGAFGVKHIDIIGSHVSGTVLNCGGDHACERTSIYGRNIASVECSGDYACAQSQWDLTCLINAPCAVNCKGDNACSSGDVETTSFIIANTAGLSCADDACSNAIFRLESNVGGGSVICHGEDACFGAMITMNNIVSIQCGGENACKNANIRIIDPQQDFEVECTAFASCQGLDLEIFLSEKSTVDFFKGFNCNGELSCYGASLTIINYSNNFLTIENLECGAIQSCKLASFDIINAEFENCKCGTAIQQSCQDTTGIESCFNGLDKLECFGMNSCQAMHQTLTNIANGFELICGSLSSCKDMELTINVNDNKVEPVTSVKGYKCGADNSCEGTLITFINSQNENDKAIIIEKIECDGVDSCKNALFKCSGKVIINDIVCSKSGACSGCRVQIGYQTHVACSSI